MVAKAIWPPVVILALALGILSQETFVHAATRDTIELANMEENPGSVSKTGLQESQKNSLLQLHNAFRSIVKPTASNMLRMTWDSELEKIASDFAAKCLVAHNPDRHKQAKHYDWVGENIAWGTGLCGDKECGDIFEGVKRWFSESKNYNFITGQCSGKCTLYTQMAWWESNKLGCGAKRCGDRTILVCNYAPGGNYVGQKPYRQGKPCSDCPKGAICDNNLCVPLDQQGTCKDCVNRGMGTHARQQTADESMSQNQGMDTMNQNVDEMPLPAQNSQNAPLLPEGWQELPVHLIQIDSGITQSTWGLNSRNTPFLLEIDNVLSRINGTLHHVSAGQSGVWGIGLLGNVFLRNGITEENPKGVYWERVRGNLKQIDSGPIGIVWGVNRFDRVFCRVGINAQSPAGTGWRLVPGDLKYISCGALGCWGVDKQGTIYFRKGVSASNPAGTEWMTIPGSLRMVESGPAGVTVGVRESPDGIQDVLYRTGVTAEKPGGLEWIKLPVKLSHVTVGSRGIMGIMHNGAVVIHKDLQIHQATTPTAAPEGDFATVAAPLESQSPAFADQPTPPSITRTFPPTTPLTHTVPISAAPVQGSLVNKHVNSESGKTQEKDPLKITPEMANKILNMIKEKGNQFEMTHKAAAQKMQKNVSTAAALAGSLALQNKLTSPQAPQPPLKNATAVQQPQAQSAPVQPVHQPVAAASPPPAQLVKPMREPLGLNKGLEHASPSPTIGGAFQNSLSGQNPTKATSEQPKVQPIANKTVDVEKPSLTAQHPSPGVTAKPQAAGVPQHPAEVVAPPKPSPHPLTKPPMQEQGQNVVSEQQEKTSAENPHNPPVQSQNAVSQEHKPVAQPQPDHAAVKPQEAVQPAAKPQAPVQQQKPIPNDKAAAPQQPPVSHIGPPAKAAETASVAPTKPKPSVPANDKQLQQHPAPQPQQQKVLPQQPKPSLQSPTAKKPTQAPTPKTNKLAAQLATATRPENIHHVLRPTGPTFKPTHTPLFKNQQAMVQHFPTKGRYRDEDYDIGLIGRKHLNEISSGSKAFGGPTRRPTQKPIRTAPVTHAVTVSYELTRSCCAIPDSVCPIPRDCTGYIECKGYNGFYRVCERGKMFHPFKNICDYPRNVDCESIKVGGVTANAQDLQDLDLAVQNAVPTKPAQNAVPAGKQALQGPDFLETEEQSPQRSDVSNAGEPMKEEIPQPRVTSPDGGNSGVLREVWFGLGLSPHLKDLIDNPRFPQTPDEYLVLDKFEAPPNAGDGYGQRLSTYFRAPTTGEYLFYIACDNECELWLSPDTDELNSNMSIELKNGHFTSFRQWTKYPTEQTSRPIKLEQGNFYFMESFMKEGTGGDNLSIGVRFPDGKTEMPIFNNLYLIPALTGPASSDKNLKSGRTKKLLENAQYNNLPVQENYLERSDRVQDVESDLDMFNTRKRTSVRRDSE